MKLLLLLAAAVALSSAESFQSRLADYQKLHDRAASQVSKLKPTHRPEDIARHQRDLAYKIRTARSQAAQGNIFTAEIAAPFKGVIAEIMKGEDGVKVRQSLARGEPVSADGLRVNQPYPKGVPLQTTPPTLLAKLPPLPTGYEYRLVGSSLVLFDVEAGLVVDYLPAAIP